MKETYSGIRTISMMCNVLLCVRVLTVTSQSRSCVSCSCLMTQHHLKHRFYSVNFITDWEILTHHLTHTSPSYTVLVTHSTIFLSLTLMHCVCWSIDPAMTSVSHRQTLTWLWVWVGL